MAATGSDGQLPAERALAAKTDGAQRSRQRGKEKRREKKKAETRIEEAKHIDASFDEIFLKFDEIFGTSSYFARYESEARRSLGAAASTEVCLSALLAELKVRSHAVVVAEATPPERAARRRNFYYFRGGVTRTDLTEGRDACGALAVLFTQPLVVAAAR
eukprot:CAMPEP_0198352036 /NCGR_PEP_ID=MMETSP1450-20131203/105390_1 /TAXON_ID=753684 ORGANISM="Madagascaria erythrocladiodes, Strain CCMP3234" /NCGR_SAMPLE_ID=MMETSP1450 /ASSEMBLY_ACC=CAM_ASM_001115 /LENGTH=159 /DNA_ID=CAMNT_0044058029 /DNA_START=23 /DNA_END=499 /DNA_ORIENTATION=-